MGVFICCGRVCIHVVFMESVFMYFRALEVFNEKNFNVNFNILVCPFVSVHIPLGAFPSSTMSLMSEETN